MRWNVALLVLLAGFSLPALAANRPQTKGKASVGKHWTLVWNDEFNGPDGSPPDPAKWSFETGGSGFGNNELETYTSRSVNAHIEHGNLAITAVKQDFTGADGIVRSYTSARIATKHHFEFKYGRVEARIRIPAGAGLWPAFWMMGANVSQVQWPACGEVDIMENVGKEPGMVHGSLHGPGYSGGGALTSAYTLPGGARFSDGFHVFAIEWEPGVIRFYVDGKLFETRKAVRLPAHSRWAFNHRFYLLLNLAVGGYWPGEPTAATRFPASMLIDYVRVYKATPPETQPSAR